MSQPLDIERLFGLLDTWSFRLRDVLLVRDGTLEQQLVETYVLFLVKHGSGRLTIDLNDYRLGPDAAHLALPGQTIGTRAEAGAGLECYMIRFQVSDGTPAGAPLPLRGEIPIHSQSEMTVLCETLYACSRSEQPLERFHGQSVFLELLYWTFKHVRAEPESDSRRALEQSRAYIEQHYNESLSIEQLARMAGVSPKYYVDLFKKTYGVSAIDYVTDLRVSHAKQLMAQAEVKLRDVAHQVGYQDEFYFSRKFKQSVGVSPSVYMKNRKRKIAVYSSPAMGHLLALHLMPFAAPLHPKWTAFYYRHYRADIPLHLSAYRFNRDWESNIEALKKAEPDMVICLDPIQPEERERLVAELPVSFIPSNQTDWREQLRMTAQLVGMPLEAESWLSLYDRKVQHARERIEREWADGTVLVLSIYHQNLFVCPARGMRDVLYADLQLKRPPGFDPLLYNQRVGLEQLAAYEADRILLNVCQEPVSLGEWQTLQAASIWRDLKAVRTHRVHVISSDPWREYSASACGRMVDDMLRLLDAAQTNQAAHAY